MADDACRALVLDQDRRPVRRMSPEDALDRDRRPVRRMRPALMAVYLPI